MEQNRVKIAGKAALYSIAELFLPEDHENETIGKALKAAGMNQHFDMKYKRIFASVRKEY